MTELLTASQMRALEQVAIESADVTGLALMERAGKAVLEAVFQQWPALDTGRHKAVVICGPGNNGGDGFVVARLLRARGWRVEAFLFGDANKLPPDAKANYCRWAESGQIRRLSDFPTTSAAPDTGQSMADLIVDAGFGTGLSRPIEGQAATLFGQIDALCRAWKSVCVAVDIPSGICADSGRILGCAVSADLTVTFHRPKLGHYLDTGPEKCGKLVVQDIGLGGERSASLPRLNAPAIKQLLDKAPGAHKFIHGHALVLSGLSGKGGAARLAARGALRIGAGLVSLGVPHAALAEHAAQVNALMLSEIGDAPALAALLADQRINALCLGPGLGLARARELVPVALACGRACVLDADALTAYKGNAAELFEITHEKCVLTPHFGEFSRLFPDIAARLAEAPGRGPAYSRVDAAQDAAERAGCVVLLKGPDTVIAAPDRRCLVNAAAYERAAPWLATAGSGDVLAGFITGLLARGFSPFRAAGNAAWLHTQCAHDFGPGLIAEDLPEQLPMVFRALNA